MEEILYCKNQKKGCDGILVFDWEKKGGICCGCANEAKLSKESGEAFVASLPALHRNGKNVRLSTGRSYRGDTLYEVYMAIKLAPEHEKESLHKVKQRLADTKLEVWYWKATWDTVCEAKARNRVRTLRYLREDAPDKFSDEDSVKKIAAPVSKISIAVSDRPTIVPKTVDKPIDPTLPSWVTELTTLMSDMSKDIAVLSRKITSLEKELHKRL